MSSTKKSSTTLLALMKRAQWNVDFARTGHMDAVHAELQAQDILEQAKQVADDAEQFTRRMLGETVFDAYTLRMANLHQGSLNVDVDARASQHQIAVEQSAGTHQLLLESRAQLQLYERLLERRACALEKENARDAQRAMDDLGLVIKISEAVGIPTIMSKD